MEPPEGYGPRPALQPHLRFYQTAFRQLNTDRLYAEGPIPSGAITRFAQEQGLSLAASLYGRLRDLIRIMDAEFMKHGAQTAAQVAEEARKRAAESPPKKPKKAL